MSWIGDTFAGLKRLIQLDADVARLDRSVEEIESDVKDHDKRLVRIETLIEVSRPAAAPLVRRSALQSFQPADSQDLREHFR